MFFNLVEELNKLSKNDQLMKIRLINKAGKQRKVSIKDKYKIRVINFRKIDIFFRIILF